MTTIALPVGYATVETRPLVSVSDWRQGGNHRRARAPFTPRKWSVRWDSIGRGAYLYLKALFADNGCGAAALEWTPPHNTDIAVKVRITSLSMAQIAGATWQANAVLEEVIEPC